MHRRRESEDYPFPPFYYLFYIRKRTQVLFATEWRNMDAQGVQTEADDLFAQMEDKASG